MKNKAQMEIMGLAIVVVLVIFAMVIVMMFTITNKPAAHAGEFSKTELPVNILGSMMYTTAPECSDVTFAELLQDCANDPAEIGDIGCPISTGPKSCDYLDDKIEDILERTLGVYQYNYYFLAFKGERETPIEITKIGTECQGDREVGDYILPLRSGTSLTVWLEICKKTS